MSKMSRPEGIVRARIIDPFFEDAINEVFLHPEKSIFVLPGAVGIGKTSAWTVRGPYSLACSVRPRKIGNRMVRESLWAAIRESERSATATIAGIFIEAIFSPDIMASDNPPMRISGSHPSIITVEHSLPDGTFLSMKIECHGFNNEQAEGRLRSREFVGVMIPEGQTVPFNIITVASERAGRWRARETIIEKEFNGRKYALSGVMQLKIVFVDINIPERPHELYEHVYDPVTLDGSPFFLLDPPSPLIPMPLEKIEAKKSPEEVEKMKAKYTITRYEKKKVMWLPNPKAYQLTKHYESILTSDTGEILYEDDGVTPKRLPLSGYDYWYQMLYKSESYIRRMILGQPDNMGGVKSVYKHFSKRTAVKEVPFNPKKDWYIGQDPGKYAAFYFMQEQWDGSIHVFKEFFFEPEDALLTRQQLEQHVFPEVDKMKSLYPDSMHHFVVDPAAQWGTASGEGSIQIIREAGYMEEPFASTNQDTDLRRDALGFYLEQEKLTVDPSCVWLIKGLEGGYCYKGTKSGMVSDIIDKNEYSHAVEACQYPVANIYFKNYLEKKNGNSSRGSRIYKVKG